MKNNLPAINHETVVFTRHAKERLDLRRVSEDMIIQVMRNPKNTYDAKDGKIKFIGKTMGAKVHAVCKPIPEDNKWIVITLWVRGEDDAGNFVGRKQRSEPTTISTLMRIVQIVFLLIIFAAIVYYLLQLA